MRRGLLRGYLYCILAECRCAIWFADLKRQSIHANNTSPPDRSTQEASAVNSSTLSASAPEFVPAGMMCEVSSRHSFSFFSCLSYLQWCQYFLYFLGGHWFLFLRRTTIFILTAKTFMENQAWLTWSQTFWVTWAPHQGPLSRILGTLATPSIPGLIPKRRWTSLLTWSSRR